MAKKTLMPGDLFFQYAAGWSAGAGHKAIDEKRSKHESKEMCDAYWAGYWDGRVANREAMKRAQQVYNYTQNIVRGI